MPLIVTPGQLTQRSEVYRQLGQLLSAGMPIINAIQLVSRNSPSKSAGQSLRDMAARLSQGETVGEVWQYFGSWVTQFDLSLIRAAEKSGRLDAVFKILADHYLAQAQMLRKILSDLAYPVFVFHFAVILFPFIAWFQGGGVTILLFRIFGVLIPFYVLIFLGIEASRGTRGEGWRVWFEQFTRRIPLLGSGRHCIALARLCMALQALLNAGVDMISAWEMAAAASGSVLIQRAVLAWKQDVSTGKLPSEAVRDEPRQFPEVFANLYHTGEISGKLDDSLLRMSAYYQELGNNKLHILASWVPRFFYFGVAAMVAFKVIGFYMSYFAQLNEVMK
jgi:type II secretory pathway component PulF